MFFFLNQQKPKIVIKRPPVANIVPLTRTPSLEHCYTRAYLRIFDPGSSNPTTFLRLCSFDDHRQSIISNGRPHLQLYRKALRFTIYDHVLRLLQKGVLFDEIYPFDCRVYLSSDICRLRWADYSANRSQRVKIVISKPSRHTVNLTRVSRSGVNQNRLVPGCPLTSVNTPDDIVTTARVSLLHIIHVHRQAKTDRHRETDIGIHIHTQAHTRTFVHTYTHAHTHAHTHTHTHTYIYIYIYIYMCVCACVCCSLSYPP